MRKTISTLLLAACLPAIALAAPQGNTTDKTAKCAAHDTSCHGHKMGMGKGHGPMADLNLTAEQQKSVRTIMREQFKARHQIIEKYLAKLPEADQKAMQAELKSARDNNQKTIRNLLTAEQQKKFDEMQAKREEHRKEWLEKKAQQAK